MANQSKLKAWVRYDGTGRVISGGPIFQVNKPKVGNWKQINANLCCNSESTTTTTTTGGGGGTPTAFIQPYWTSEVESCNSTTFGNLLFYSSSTVVQPGIAIFQDAQLTTPVLQGRVINVGMTYPRLVVGVGGVLSVYTCSSSVSYAITSGGYSNESSACQNVFGMSSTVYGSSNPLGVTTFYYDSGLTNVFTGSQSSNNYAFYITGTSTTYTAVIDEAGNVTGNALCPISNDIFAVTNYNAYDACQGSGTTLNLFYPLNQSLGIGTTLFFNPALTIPYDPGAAGNYVRLYFQAEDQVCTMSGNVIQSYVACSGITTTTTTTTVMANSVNVKLSNVSAPDACFNGGIVPTTVYTTAPYGNYPAGTVLYFDAQLTQPVNYSYVSNPGIGIVWQCNNGVLSTGSNCF